MVILNHTSKQEFRDGLFHVHGQERFLWSWYIWSRRLPDFVSWAPTRMVARESKYLNGVLENLRSAHQLLCAIACCTQLLVTCEWHKTSSNFVCLPAKWQGMINWLFTCENVWESLLSILAMSSVDFDIVVEPPLFLEIWQTCAKRKYLFLCAFAAFAMGFSLHQASSLHWWLCYNSAVWVEVSLWQLLVGAEPKYSTNAKQSKLKHK